MSLEVRSNDSHKKEMEIFKWCIKNYIRAYPEPIGPGRKQKVYIILDYKGQIKRGKKLYIQNSDEYKENLRNVYEWAYNNAHDQIKRQQKIKVDNST